MNEFWSNKRVLITGHTGFKGAWLSLWLTDLGAEVVGIALEPSDNSLFELVNLRSHLTHQVIDIRDAEKLRAGVLNADPDIVFHLAAQPLVIDGYEHPLETFDANVMGTANLLNALRQRDRKCAVVCVTTDKVYKNREWDFGYREDDALGGHDPYSASKAAAELVADCWSKSFFHDSSPVRIATARAGNVIGGGDMSHNRLVPDIARALSKKETLTLRNPNSTRPWQHVLDPLSGYINLAESLYADEQRSLPRAFNFGPDRGADRSVAQLVELAHKIWPNSEPLSIIESQHHEAERLALSIDRAASVLGWSPKWNFERSVTETMEWYKAMFEGSRFDPRKETMSQIERFRREDYAA